MSPNFLVPCRILSIVSAQDAVGLGLEVLGIPLRMDWMSFTTQSASLPVVDAKRCATTSWRSTFASSGVITS
jgi:hypothetical protein